jgi:long-chain acyl-CoA synthetase
MLPSTDAATVVELFHRRVEELGHRPALREKQHGRWQSTTWAEWSERSHRIAAALCERGLEVGDRVALAASTRLPWVLVDLAVWLAGGVSATVYSSSAAEPAQQIVEDAQARFVLVDSAAQADQLWPNRGGLTVVSIEPPGDDRTATDGLVSLTALEQEGQRLLKHADRRAALQRRWQGCGPTDVATVVYSSGTTGEAKGVALSHANLLFEVSSITEALELGPDDEQLLFLPLAHIFGRMLVLVQIGTGMVTSFAPSMWNVMDSMAEVNPTLFASVPRLFEKIYAVTQQRSRYEGPIRRRLLDWASNVAGAVARAEYEGRRVPRATALQHRYADRMVLARVREQFGSRLRFAVSGGAPLSEELARWFYAAGVLVLEVYGLTECTGGATLNRPDCFAFGSVGPPLPGVEVRVADDGEVLIRGPNVMKGYWRRPDATAQVVDEEGWLHTGDLGEYRVLRVGARGARAHDERVLRITGRSKDLLVTAGGSNVAPRRIEQLLEGSPWISRAVVFGDRRPYLVALLTLDVPAVTRWAEEHGLSVDAPAELARHPEVRGLIDTELELANQRLARFETIKRYALLDRELSLEAGELADTLKVKRHVVAERHGPTIAALYDDEPVV